MRTEEEKQVIETVCAFGRIWGFGNLIDCLKTAWSESLLRTGDFDRKAADRAAGHICVWCGVDTRTGRGIRMRTIRDDDELKEMGLGKAVRKVQQDVYDATAIFERLESFGKIVGNSHHIRQKAADMIGELMRERWK